jgi:xanthine dehydrogenase accessory factor
VREVIHDIRTWLARDERVALTTVISTWGSAPRGVGAKMAVSSSGAISGSVSGGCVESAVVDASLQVLASGTPQLLRFGVSDDAAWEVGLACGGSIELVIKELDPGLFQWVDEHIDGDDSFAIITRIAGPPDEMGTSFVVDEGGIRFVEGSAEVPQAGSGLILDTIRSGDSQRRKVQQENGSESEYFVDVISPPPTLIMVGGVHISVTLARLAKTIGFRTVIIEPRRVFADQERFPFVDLLIQAWPEEAFKKIPLSSTTAVAVLTHDPKIDDQAMKIALPSEAFYVGGLGSKKTQALRRERLIESGLSPGDLDRLHGPIGLALGARTAEEIALSILAEIVGVQRNHPAA